MNIFQVRSLFTSVVVKWSLFDTVSVTAHCSAGSYYKLAQTMYHDENSTFSDKIFFFMLKNRIPQHMHFWHYVICSRIQPGACSTKRHAHNVYSQVIDKLIVSYSHEGFPLNFGHVLPSWHVWFLTCCVTRLRAMIQLSAC